MPDYFRRNAGALQLRRLVDPNNGYRPGQLGALHAVLMHVSVSDEPSILVLPTGYGKTAVLMSLPFILETGRVLVVEPSGALRRQTTGHFKGLSTLKKLRVVPADLAPPVTHGQKGRLDKEENWARLMGLDVVVSTPNSTSPHSIPDFPSDLFELIIFDEAHHAPADSWAAYLEHYREARFVFLTATPFRRDGKLIPGKIAYNYPVSKASKERAFGKVHFRAAPVRDEEDDEEIDRSVARTASAQLRADVRAGFDHRLFARAASIRSARRLVDLYTSEGLKVRAIDSHISAREQDKAERALIEGELDGIVCVDMFGEGYDFPKLKVAALHAPHASLVPTLQFIGRFARTTDAATGDATLVAPLSRVREATARLFRDGIDVGQFVDAAAQEKIASSERQQRILEVLTPREQAESDYDAVSPLSLELFAHTRIFQCEQKPDFGAIGAIIAKKLRKVKQWANDDGTVALLLTVDHSPPDWAASDAITNLRHDVFLLAYNAATGLCFIGSTRRTERIYINLMQSACQDKHRPISYERTRRAIAGLTNLRFYNLGLRNTAVNSQSEVYRVLTGPHAERVVTMGDARSYVQGHFYGSGEIGDGRETVGASSSSRIWSNRRLDVGEYIDWVTALNRRMSGAAVIADSQFDIIQHSKTIKRLPPVVLCGIWNKDAYRQGHRVRCRHVTWLSYQTTVITELELSTFRVSADRKTLDFEIESDACSVPFRFRCETGLMYELADVDWSIEVQGHVDEWTDLADWMTLNPPTFYAADKSSFQGMDLIGAPSLRTRELLPGTAEALDWQGCAIGVEFEMGKAGGKSTVHQALEAYLRARTDVIALLYDHRTGEAADFVLLTSSPDGGCFVELFHCKGAGGKPNGERVDDVYEVAGQMIKSITYCEAVLLLEHVKRRINPVRHTKPSKFLIGDLNLFERTLMGTPANLLRFGIYGVQPGIALGKVDEHLADLMNFGLDFALRGGATTAGWIVSA